MSERDHAYRARLVWDGNLGDGTAKYETYGRQHRLLFAGKPGIEATADPAFRGDPARLNPEDLLVGALASCHMLSYLALCARSRIRVLAYEDDAHGVMREDGRGGGRFEWVELRPRVRVSGPADVERATRLHDKAHELCFISSSCNFPVRHRAEVRV
ncbi:MAG: OsmC family protein [Acidobacteria bacterium]|nr:OsmC family protein [Acidobacteriota bacterium]